MRGCKEANLGYKLNDPSTSSKLYWKIRKRAPRIPPILFNNLFVLDCKEKAKLFNDFFSNQCKLTSTSSILPNFYYHTDKRLDDVIILDDEILSLICNINPNKASGSDGVSGHMLLLQRSIFWPKILNSSPS